MMAKEPMEPVAAEEPLNVLKWAQSAQDAGSKVGLAQLLTALQLLATDGDRKNAVNKTWRDRTPASMQVIKSGALSLTKAWSTWVAGAGGLSAVVAAGTAFFGSLRSDLGDPIIVALVAGASLILSATGIALALFIKGDLEARGQATAARHAGRAEVASAFLRATAEIPKSASSRDVGGAASGGLTPDLMLALAGFPGKVRIQVSGDPSFVAARGIRTHTSYGLQIDTAGGWVAIDQVEGFTTADNSPPAIAPP
jgi:hypothetical protein